MDKRQHCLDSEPTGLLRTDKGKKKNARRDLVKQKKMDLDMKAEMMFG